MKDSLIVGDTLDFMTSVPDYPATAGYTLKYRLIPRTSGTAILLTASASGDDYRAQEPPAVTETWAAGEYTWSAWVEKTGERYSVDSGIVTLKADPGVVAAYDGRSHARKVLDAIEAILEGRATLDQEEYAINGRSLKRTPIAQLMQMRDAYRAEAWREAAALKTAAGLPNPRQIRVRMARV
jgi:hypothetical protein